MREVRVIFLAMLNDATVLNKKLNCNGFSLLYGYFTPVLNTIYFLDLSHFSLFKMSV